MCREVRGVARKKGGKKLECVGAEARVTLSHPLVSLLMGLSCCSVRPHPVALMFDFQTAKSKQGRESSPGMKDGEGRGAGDQEQTWKWKRPGLDRRWMVFARTIRHPAKTPDVSWIYTRQVHVKRYNPPSPQSWHAAWHVNKSRKQGFFPRVTCDPSDAKTAPFTTSFYQLPRQNVMCCFICW